MKLGKSISSEQVSEEVRQNQQKLMARLARLQVADQPVVIDDQFLTCGEYQLFRDDSRVQAATVKGWEKITYYRQPDHWTAYKYREGAADLPITGLRSSDAQAFCDWLNKTQSPQTGLHYRLPTPQEAALNLPQPANSTLASWCRDGDSFSLVGLSEDYLQELKQTLLAFIDQDHYPELETAIVKVGPGEAGKLPQLQKTLRTFINWEHHPELNVNLFVTDLDWVIREGFGFYPDFSHWDYSKIDLFGLREALDKLFSFHGSPKYRDMVMATSLDIAHAQTIAHLITVARMRRLEGKFGPRLIHNRLDLSGFTSVIPAILQADWSKAQQNIAQLLALSDESLRHWVVILYDYMNIARAATFKSLQQAVREHVAHLSWFAYQGYAELNSKTPEQNLKNHWKKAGAGEIMITESFRLMIEARRKLFDEMPKTNGIPHDTKAARELVGDYAALQWEIGRINKLWLSLFWQMQILLARESGHLAAWEGLRLVAERPAD